MNQHYDYVIVGGGSAGSALGNRLSSDPSTRVLVLEAGRSDFRVDPFIHMPAALPYPIGNRLYDWKYESDPEPEMGGRRVYHARGKVLGGSSSINGMIFQRGNPMDYQRWAGEQGMDAWDYAHCLPYFKRMETVLLEDGSTGADAWRGGSGPLVVERGPASSPLFGAFFEAVQQAGYPLTDDVNGYRQEGFAKFDRNVHRGRRLSAARAYLHPVRSRKNLKVETLAMVTGLRMEGNRCTGVDYVRGGKAHRSVTAGEVVLCGGAFNSPQLLQLAGIGDPEVLSAAGVRTRVELPGVGANLQDHLEVYVQHAATQPVSIAPWLAHHHKPRIGAEWLFGRRGVGASNHFEAGGFIRSNDEVEWPNLMFHFLPIAIRYDGSKPAESPYGIHGYQVHIGPMYADTRGMCGSGRPTPTSTRRSGSTTSPPRTTGGSGSRWCAPRATSWSSPPSRRSAAARSHPAPGWRPTRRSCSGCVTTPRRPCTRPAPPRWAPTTRPWSTRAACGCTAPRGCGWWTPRSSRSSPTATSTRR